MKNWSCVGNSLSAKEAAEKLNDINIGTSATISLNAVRNAFVIWASHGNANSSKTWKTLANVGSQEEISNIMDNNDLDYDSAIVSIDSNGNWQLWGYVNA